MKLVTISHPDVGTARVPASAVPHHAASGWSVVPDVPAKPAVAKPSDESATPTGSADGSASKSKSKESK